MSARLPNHLARSKTLLEQIVDADAPQTITNFELNEIQEDLRRLYTLTETTSAEQPAQAFSLAVNTVPDGFIKLKSNAKPLDIISGRLGLATGGPCYKVTPEEVGRRIDGVEKLNTSNLANNLKKQKQKYGGEAMRNQLAEHGLQINLHAHCREAPTRVISLLEGEALHLAADLQTICNTEYPAKNIAKEVIKEAENDVNLMDALSDTNSFSECMSALEDVFKAVDPPLSGVVPKPSKNQTLNRSTEKFSSATHGLGVATQRIWAKEMKRIGEEMAAIFEQQGQQSKTFNRRK